MSDALFTISNVIDENAIEDLRHFKTTVGSHDAKVTKGDGGIYKDLRDAKVKEVSHLDFPDVCENILDIVPIHRPNLFKDHHYIGEFNYLMYEVGGHFIKHRDYLNKNNGDPFSNRIFSTITLLDKSDDLEGGDLLVWSREDDQPWKAELEIGETVIFHAMKFHQVTPIIRGTREVLVAWIYLKR